jgi:hypothetical protein
MQSLSDNLDDAEYLAAIARVYQDAQRFQKLVQSQAELVRRLERFKSQSLGAGVSALELMGQRQQEIQKELQSLSEDLMQHAKALPEDMQMLAQDAQKFVKIIGEAEIEDQMSNAISATDNQNGRGAWQSASLALERMKALIPPPEENQEGECPGGNCFASLCSGGDCQGNRPGLSQSLAQMLDSLRRGQKSGMGGIGKAGGGVGGDPNDGYWVPGQSMLQLPIYGPSRSEYNRMSMQAQGGKGEGSTAGGQGLVQPHARESLNVPRDDNASSRSMLIEELPDKYREAVKIYFTPEAVQGVQP